MKEYLIVDGYNVIFSWPELLSLSKHSLEHARLQLQSWLQNYGRYKGYEVVLVYDGKQEGVPKVEEWVTNDFLLVYTSEDMTADSYIEKIVLEKQSRFTNIYVVTSDKAEQHQILGSGGLRVPTRELRLNVFAAKKEERDHYTNSPSSRQKETIDRNELGSLVDDKVAKKLEALRLGRDHKP